MEENKPVATASIIVIGPSKLPSPPKELSMIPIISPIGAITEKITTAATMDLLDGYSRVSKTVLIARSSFIASRGSLKDNSNLSC
jgi:hypothetical protein